MLPLSSFSFSRRRTRSRVATRLFCTPLSSTGSPRRGSGGWSGLLPGLMLLLIAGVCIIGAASPAAAQTVAGRVVDDTGEALIGVNVTIQDTFIGTTTDSDGAFALRADFDEGPQTVVFTFVGFETETRTLEAPRQDLRVALTPTVYRSDEVIVAASRAEQRILETPVTVDRISTAQLETAPVTELLASLESLQGVDVSRSSLLFSSLSTRGFNSAKSERLIQLVDYVDYVSPTLSIYPGNIAGPPKIDVASIDIIHGANSALYGANAFNGVVLMNTKNAFSHPGLQLNLRGGNREFVDVSGRFARAFSNRVAVKVVGRYLRADEFIAANQAAHPQSVVPDNNPAGDARGFDAVNRYGEVNLSQNADLAPVLSSFGVDVSQNQIFTPGFREEDLAPDDFQAGMWQINPTLSALLTEDLKATYAFRYAQGNGIYQSSNRYAFDDFAFNLHSLELLGQNWTVRGYRTDDSPGDTFDMNLLGSFMNQQPYRTGGAPSPVEQALLDQGAIAPGATPYAGAYAAVYGAAYAQARQQGASETDAFAAAREAAATVYPSIGEDRFTDVRSATLDLPASGASPTFDSDSQLYHVEGQYDWSFSVADVSVGANYRRFRLTSNGTLFSDGENASPLQPDGTRDVRDEIINEEAGGYLRVQRGFFDDRWNLSAVGRVDAFKNFDTRFSPRVTSVVTLGENREHNLRASVSQAYRSPAQLDQYIYLDIGPILLQGNVDDGFFGLNPFAAKPLEQQLADGDQFRVAPLELEKMTSVEVGYKGVLFERVLADLSYYHSWYTDFIGTRRFVGKEDGTQITAADFSPDAAAPARLMQVWLNADENVRTQGLQVALEVPVVDALTLTGNYTWADISEGEAALKERINLGFNTPEHKFNIGARLAPIDRLTVTSNLRWVDSYLYEMPFSEGRIEQHYTLDAQISYAIPEFRSTLQVGGTNVTDRNNVSAFGAAPIGRMLYAGLSVRY